MKILFFIGTLCAGGKERRLIELLTYLKKKNDYSLFLVLRRDQIEYPGFYDLNIPYKILTNNYKKGDITLHFRFYKICKDYKPDILHTWGSMPAFVSLLPIILQRIPHVNSQITDAPPNIKKWSLENLVNRINFRFSTIILSNSYAGLNAYKPEKRKSAVIHNGINLDRFNNLPDKQKIRTKYGILTDYTLIMVASFTDNKDYDRFLEIAVNVNRIRNDITFLAVGNGIHLNRIKKRVLDEKIQNVVFTGKIHEVEGLINIADIGILFSPNGEGISNAILEYMSLGKPVVAMDTGGTKEIVKHLSNGYLITNETPAEISGLLENLLDDKEKRLRQGEAGKKLIQESYSVDIMGDAFDKVYKNLKH